MANFILSLQPMEVEDAFSPTRPVVKSSFESETNRMIAEREKQKSAEENKSFERVASQVGS